MSAMSYECASNMNYLCLLCNDTFKSIKARKEHEDIIHCTPCELCGKQGEVRLDDRELMTCEDCAEFEGKNE